MSEQLKITVDDESQGQRLDSFLTDNLGEISRSQVTRIIKQGSVSLNGKGVNPSHHIRDGEEYEVNIPEAEAIDVVPENLNLDIVFEDKDIIIINKPAGMVVHPAKGNHTGTLVNGLLYHCKDLSGIGGKMRPGIVHRIDKDTSGLIAVAKNDPAHKALSEQLASREMGRKYLAVVRGIVKKRRGQVNLPIGRHPNNRKKMSTVTKLPKDALTDYQVIETFKDTTYIKVKLSTGRTHQIRVHMSAINHPVLGDMIYGKKKTSLIDRFALHASELQLTHPTTKEEILFRAELPKDFKELLDALSSGA